jgi:tetratricopeptide (TPR) repeat protein
MSPEQHRCEQVGPESDQFSFCVMVYEALFGARPFGGRTIEEVALEVSEGRIKPPPARSKVPRHVRRALVRGLATDPAARWPSMDALLDAVAPRPTGRRAATAALGVVAAGAVTFALLAGRDGDPDAAARASARESAAGVWSSQARAELAAAFVATGHSAAPGAASTVTRSLDRYLERWIEARVLIARRNRDGSDPLALAQRRRECLGRRLDEARAVVDTLRGVDASMIERAADAVRLLTPVSVCTEGNALAGRMPPPEEAARRDRFRALEGELDHIKALAHVGKIDEATALATRTVAAARELDHPPLTAEALFALGGLQGSRNDSSLAQRTLEEALVEVARAGDDELAGKIWIRFLGIAASAGEVERCRAIAAGASAAIERAQLPELRIWFDDAMGTVANAAADFAEAERLHRGALALAERTEGTDGADLGFLHLHLASDLVELGRLDEARAELEKGRASAIDELGATNPYMQLFDTQAALIAQASGDFATMLAATEELAKRPTAPTAAFVQYLHGTALFGVGRVDEAVAPLRAAAVSFAAKGDTQREYESRINLSITFYTLNQYADAAPEAERAIEIAARAFASGDPRLADARLHRGLVALEMSELERALSQCRAALDLYTEIGGDADPQRVIPLVCLSRATRRQGDARAALGMAREAHRLAGATSDPGLLLETSDELSMVLWETGDKAGARDAVARAIAAAEALGQDTAELRERQAKFRRSRR